MDSHTANALSTETNTKKFNEKYGTLLNKINMYMQVAIEQGNYECHVPVAKEDNKPKEIISGETIIKLSVSSLSKVGKTIWLYQIIRFIINKTIVIGAKYHLLFLNSTIKSFLLILNHAPNMNGKDVLNPIPGQ